ncbi:MAG: membrane protein insertion efficiency factor YidD, partial [Flaviramulus sp.]
MKKLLIAPFLFLIKVYQTLISPITPATCRYQPTCSH